MRGWPRAASAGGGGTLGRDRERAGAAIARHATALAGEERSGACAACLGDLDDDAESIAAARVACGNAFHASQAHRQGPRAHHRIVGRRYTDVYRGTVPWWRLT